LPAEADDDYEIRLAQQNSAEDTAVEVLYALSGRQFGICEAVARPCSTPAFRGTMDFFGGPLPMPVFTPTFWDGAWRNLVCGCGDRCVVGGPRVVHLPGPVSEVTTVTIGSMIIGPDQYVLEGDALYRKGGNWPSQDLGKPLDEEGTWSVEYLKGWPPPAGAAMFVGVLAKEFMSACSGTACRLPRNVIGVNRNGVSYQIYDPSALMRSGKTGISEIDLWLSAINPNALMAAPTVI
jgi:hypothetical protein